MASRRLVVSQVRTLVRALCETEPDPLKILWRINDRLAADLEPGQFVTAFLGFISPDGSLDWCTRGMGRCCCVSLRPAVARADLPPLGLMNHDDDCSPSPSLSPPATACT